MGRGLKRKLAKGRKGRSRGKWYDRGNPREGKTDFHSGTEDFVRVDRVGKDQQTMRKCSRWVGV